MPLGRPSGPILRATPAAVRGLDLYTAEWNRIGGACAVRFGTRSGSHIDADHSAGRVDRDDRERCTMCSHSRIADAFTP